MKKPQLAVLTALTVVSGLALTACGGADNGASPTTTSTSISAGPSTSAKRAGDAGSETNRRDPLHNPSEDDPENNDPTPGGDRTASGSGNSQNNTGQEPARGGAPAPAADPAQDEHSDAPADSAVPPAATPAQEADAEETASPFTPCDSEGATAIQPGEINNTDLICVAGGDGDLQWEPK